MTFVRDLMIIGGLLVFASGLFDDSFLFFRFAPSESPISIVFFFLLFNAVKSIIVCLVQFMSHCVPFPFWGTVVLMITRNNAFSIYTVCMGLMRNYRLGSLP